MLRIIAIAGPALLATVGVSQMLPNRPGLTLDEQSAWVVNTTRVSRQLKLQPNQQQKVSDAFNVYSHSENLIFAKSAPTQQQLNSLDHKLATSVLSALTETQRVRLHQLSLQLSGPFILGDPGIATEVGLTALQKVKITAIIEAAKKRQEAFDDSEGAVVIAHPNSTPAQQTQYLAGLAPKKRQVKIKKMLDEQKVIQMLSKRQLSKWNTMLGQKML